MTCGTMARDDLLGQALEIKEQPSRALATEAKGRILVAYGESVVWLLEAEECQTWFVSLLLSPDWDITDSNRRSCQTFRHFGPRFPNSGTKTR